MAYSEKRKGHRKFNNKVYRFHNALESKRDAQQEAETCRRRGKLARVVIESYRGYDKYSVYTRVK